jgi:HEAT repeat protein
VLRKNRAQLRRYSKVADGKDLNRSTKAMTNSNRFVPPFRPEALRSLSNGDDRQRAQAAAELGALGRGRADVDAALLRAARDPSREVRRLSVRSLAVLDPHRSLRPLLAAIRGVNEEDVEADSSPTAVEVGEYPGLARLSSFDAMRLIAEALSAPDPGTRKGAVEAALQTRDPQVPALLHQALTADPDADVRAAAAMGLGSIGDESVETALEEARSDPSALVRKEAGRAISALRLRSRQTDETRADDIRVYSKLTHAADALERRFGERAAWLVFLLVLRPLGKAYFKIRDR